MIQRECHLLCTRLVIEVNMVRNKEWNAVRGCGTLASFTDEVRTRN